MKTCKVFVVSALSTAALVACGGAQEVEETKLPETIVRVQDLPQVIRDGFLVVRGDTNADGKSDVERWYLHVDEGGNEVPITTDTTDEQLRDIRIQKKTLDVNQDGAIDVVRNYDDRERLERIEADSNFDGKLDRVTVYEKGEVKLTESDHNGDGNMDERRYFRGGKLHRTEFDTNFDGVMDGWHYYDAAGLQRAGADTDRDGLADSWIRRPAVAAPTADEGSGATNLALPSNDEAPDLEFRDGSSPND